MSNELLLALSVIVCFGGVIAAYRLWGLIGLTCFTVFASIAANIEVLITIEAFGMEQTLGNVIFASTFLVTDIISEIYGKKDAQRTVYIGAAFTALFVVVSQLWLLYTPGPNDWAMDSIRTLFSITPRLMLASLFVYLICQRLDVALYHFWWDLTSRKADKKRYLWLRNNGSTLISQLFNAVLFNLFAFYGIYDWETLFSIIISSYVIFIFTSLLDTPFLYLARKIKPRA
ncbi:MAG: queuosine precursor transporter [Oscillospiraceae bacterium]